MTTIVILISVLNNLLCQTVKLTEEEKNDNLSLLTKNFTTVDSDNQLFKDYIVNLIGLRCTIKPETDSQNLIVEAFNYFRKQLYDKRYKDLKNLLNAVQNATCTIHMVNNKTDAIQMFLSQNKCVKYTENRTDLSFYKAQFISDIHLYGGDEKDKMIGEVEEAFKNIYKPFSQVEKHLLKNEDKFFKFAQSMSFNLLKVNEIDKISAELSELSNSERIDFIKKFTCNLKSISEYIPDFFKKEKESIIIHSFVAALLFSKQDLIDIVMLFICKAYSLGFKIGEIEQLCKRLESIIIRDNAIVLLDGLCDHLGVIYETFGKEDGAEENLKKMDNEIKKLKKNLNLNDDKFRYALRWSRLVKFLLWKYENHLIEEGKGDPIRVDKDKYELDHIAPQTENPEKGYGEYDEEFRCAWLDNIGNCLLSLENDKILVGNKPFEKKRATYTHLKQQLEIQELTKDNRIWDKEKIKARDKKIIKFLLETYK